MEALFEAMLTVILEPLLAMLGEVLLWVLLYLLAFPVCCILLTPVVLVFALFGPGTYSAKVVSGYKGICQGIGFFGPGVPPP